MQKTWVLSLIQEDPTCLRAAKHVWHIHWACTLSPGATTTDALHPRARTPQQEKPLQWEDHVPQPEYPPRRNYRKAHAAVKTQDSQKTNK